MKLDLNQSSLVLVLVIALAIYYSSNALSSRDNHVKKYVYKNRRTEIPQETGEHGGLVVSSPEINVHTRGPEMNYQQQGILYKEGADGSPNHLGLYGRQKYPGSSQWEYMVSDKSLDNIKIPLGEQKNELMDDDEIAVKGFGDGYKVELYPNEELKYLPY